MFRRSAALTNFLMPGNGVAGKPFHGPGPGGHLLWVAILVFALLPAGPLLSSKNTDRENPAVAPRPSCTVKGLSVAEASVENAGGIFSDDVFVFVVRKPRPGRGSFAPVGSYFDMARSVLIPSPGGVPGFHPVHLFALHSRGVSDDQSLVGVSFLHPGQTLFDLPNRKGLPGFGRRALAFCPDGRLLPGRPPILS